MLRRDSLTKQVNSVMRKLSKTLPNQPNITSHSFRTGFITQLWRDTNDVEFVRQVIGHIKIESTSAYIKKLSEKERQERVSLIKKPKPDSNINKKYYG